MNTKQSNNLITLDNSLDPLKVLFNAHKERARFIALISGIFGYQLFLAFFTAVQSVWHPVLSVPIDEMLSRS